MKDLNGKKIYNDLEPLKRKGRNGLGDYIVFDIEANNWKDFLIGGIYDGTSFKTSKSIGELLNQIRSYKNYKVFAHFGGIYDFLFILDHVGIQKLERMDLIMRGSSIFTFKLGSNTFYDSSGIFPFSLEKTARAFNVPFQKLQIDHSKKKHITPDLIKYLEHDCRALYDSIKAFYDSPLISRANFKATIASQSVEVLRLYLDKKIPSINNLSHEKFIREAYAGGRVEIFKPVYHHRQNPLYYYDFNSLYPSIMREIDVPGRVSGVSKRIIPMGISDILVESPSDIYLPILWKKTKSKFFFPRGEFRGTFCGSEIIEAQKAGYKIKKVFRTLEFENLGKLFSPFIDDLYQHRLNSTDETQSMIAKLLMNSCYGRLAIKRERDSVCIDDGTSNLKPMEVYIGKNRLAKKETIYRGFSHAGIGAMITAEARLKLYRAMKPIERNVYYCDTDSIVTDIKLSTSEKLGELKLEDSTKPQEGYHRAAFLLPKSYIFPGQKKTQVKLKGFPKEFAASLNFTDFIQAMEGEIKISTKMNKPEWLKEKTKNFNKLVRLKSAKNNNGSILKVINNSEREIFSKYDKRELIKTNGSWDTIPRTIKSITGE